LGYARGDEPGNDLLKLAASLPDVKNTPHTPQVFADAQRLADMERSHRAWLAGGLCLAAAALLAAFYVRRRRKLSPAEQVLIVALTLAALGSAGDSAVHAFVTYPDRTHWDLDTPISGKVANHRIIWRQGAVSQSNPNVFTSVQGSFDQWGSISGSRLAF